VAGPLIAGVMADLTGNYRSGFLILALLAGRASRPGSVMFLLARKTRTAPATAGAVLTKATLRAAGLLGLSNAAVARIVGVSEATMSRMASGERQLRAGEQAGGTRRLAGARVPLARRAGGQQRKHRRLWMSTFNQAFNQTPREAIETVDGLTRVVRYLDGARALA
jgi:hypothetical protein